MNKLQIVEREMRALALYYRHDWSDFDGRQLLREVSTLFDWLNDPESRDEFTEYTDMLNEQSK